VVVDVTASLLAGHPIHGVAQRDVLVEGGEGAELDPPPQGGLPDEQACERRVAVHVGVGHESEFFELVGIEQMRFVDFTDR
jgi:hypothetical protein